MKIIISVILIMNFLFTPVFAFASDVSSESNTSYTLQDVLDGNSEAESQFRFIAESFGQSATATIDELLVAPLKAVASSFMATGQDMIDSSLDLLKNNTEFMRSIFINPYTKSFSWGSDAARHGGGEGSSLSDLFHDKVYDNVPPGFYPCSWEAPLRARSLQPDRWFWFTSDFECYYTNIGSGHMVICSLFSDTNSITVHIRDKNNGKPTSNTDGSESQSFVINNIFPYNDKNYKYSISYFFQQAPSDWLPPVVYGSESAACEAFYGYIPSSQDVPNGKGYLRPINININASGDNVYNRNWDNVITTNFNDFGADFSLTVVNNYYYDSPSSDTPSYWYDIYDNNTVSIPQHDYDDLSDVTLANPNIIANHNFITDVFGAIPVVLSTLFISCLLLAIVIIFLKG